MNASTLARLCRRTAEFWDRLFSRRVCPSRPARPARRRLLLEALEVREVLSAPVAYNDTYTAPGSALTATASTGVLANDASNGNGTLTASLVNGAAHGMLMLNTDGSFSYTGYTGYSGQDSFTYRDYAGMQSSNTATVTLTVTAAPAPVANNDSYNVANGALTITAGSGVLNNDSSNGNGNLSAYLLNTTTHGMLSFNFDGSFSYTGYAGYSGLDSFTYRDMAGMQSSNTATVTLNVTGMPGPVANNDSYSVSNGALTITAASGVLANDASNGNGSLFATAVTYPSHGMLSFNSDGSFSYTGYAGYSGQDSFTYRDTAGMQASNTATVTLNVIPQVVANDDSYTVTAGALTTTAAGGVLANDSSGGAGNLSAILATGAAHGTVTLNPDGSFSYAGASGYAGPDSFTYYDTAGVLVSNTATVTLAVAANHPPVFTATPYIFTIPEDSANGDPVGTTAATDADPGDTLTFSITGGNPGGAFAIDAGSGKITVADPSQLNYLQQSQYALTVTVTDGKAPVNAAVTVNLTPASGVVANDDRKGYSTTPGESLVTDAAHSVLLNDYSLLGKTIWPKWYTEAKNGTVTLKNDGTFTYTPNTGFQGDDTFTYAATDGTRVSQAATVTIHVTPAVYKATADAYYIQPGMIALSVPNASLGVLGNDANGNAWQGGYTAVLDSGPVDRDEVTSVENPDPTQPFLFGCDGTFRFAPKPGWHGYATFRYHFVDPNRVASASTTVTITQTATLLGNTEDYVPSDAKPGPLGGEALVGGGIVPNDAMDFLINHANHGDFVILTASSETAGPDSLLDKFWLRADGNTDGTLMGEETLNSIREFAISPQFDNGGVTADMLDAIRHSEGIFITGGDQANYATLWPDSGVRGAINFALGNGATIGGTSAGLAILGGVAYTAEGPNGTISSQQALANPKSPDITLAGGFLNAPNLENVVTETHFQPSDNDDQGRMGRLLAFMAAAAANGLVEGDLHAIAVSRSTALLVEADGSASVVQAPTADKQHAVYFLTAPDTTPMLAAGVPLEYSGVQVVKLVKGGGQFDLSNWTGAGLHYEVSATAGHVEVEGNNDIY